MLREGFIVEELQGADVSFAGLHVCPLNINNSAANRAPGAVSVKDRYASKRNLISEIGTVSTRNCIFKKLTWIQTRRHSRLTFSQIAPLPNLSPVWAPNRLNLGAPPALR